MNHDEQRALSVVTDIFGVSGRDMLAALMAGERDPKTLAQLAWRTMRAKITILEEAFIGHFTSHHAFLLGRMLSRVDAISADIAPWTSGSPSFPVERLARGRPFRAITHDLACGR